MINQIEWVNNASKEITTPVTLVHGDFKSANISLFITVKNCNFDEIYIFFQEDPTTKTVKQVSVIDWQWCGIGLGISDVMYLVLGTFNLGLHHNNFALEKKIVAYH